MIVLNAYSFLELDKVDAAIAASKINKANALQEPGCLRFDYYLSGEEPNKFVFVEEWETKADLDFHVAQKGFGEFMTAMSDCIVGPPEIRIFEATQIP